MASNKNNTRPQRGNRSTASGGKKKSRPAVTNSQLQRRLWPSEKVWRYSVSSNVTTPASSTVGGGGTTAASAADTTLRESDSDTDSTVETENDDNPLNQPSGSSGPTLQSSSSLISLASEPEQTKPRRSIRTTKGQHSGRASPMSVDDDLRPVPRKEAARNLQRAVFGSSDVSSEDESSEEAEKVDTEAESGPTLRALESADAEGGPALSASSDSESSATTTSIRRRGNRLRRDDDPPNVPAQKERVAPALLAKRLQESLAASRDDPEPTRNTKHSTGTSNPTDGGVNDKRAPNLSQRTPRQGTNHSASQKSSSKPAPQASYAMSASRTTTTSAEKQKPKATPVNVQPAAALRTGRGSTTTSVPQRSVKTSSLVAGTACSAAAPVQCKGANTLSAFLKATKYAHPDVPGDGNCYHYTVARLLYGTASEELALAVRLEMVHYTDADSLLQRVIELSLGIPYSKWRSDTMTMGVWADYLQVLFTEEIWDIRVDVYTVQGTNGRVTYQSYTPEEEYAVIAHRPRCAMLFLTGTEHYRPLVNRGYPDAVAIPGTRILAKAREACRHQMIRAADKPDSGDERLHDALAQSVREARRAQQLPRLAPLSTDDRHNGVDRRLDLALPVSESTTVADRPLSLPPDMVERIARAVIDRIEGRPTSQPPASQVINPVADPHTHARPSTRELYSQTEQPAKRQRLTGDTREPPRFTQPARHVAVENSTTPSAVPPVWSPVPGLLFPHMAPDRITFEERPLPEEIDGELCDSLAVVASASVGDFILLISGRAPMAQAPATWAALGLCSLAAYRVIEYNNHTYTLQYYESVLESETYPVPLWPEVTKIPDQSAWLFRYWRHGTTPARHMSTSPAARPTASAPQTPRWGTSPPRTLLQAFASPEGPLGDTTESNGLLHIADPLGISHRYSKNPAPQKIIRMLPVSVFGGTGRLLELTAREGSLVSSYQPDVILPAANDLLRILKVQRNPRNTNPVLPMTEQFWYTHLREADLAMRVICFEWSHLRHASNSPLRLAHFLPVDTAASLPLGQLRSWYHVLDALTGLGEAYGCLFHHAFTEQFELLVTEVRQWEFGRLMTAPFLEDLIVERLAALRQLCQGDTLRATTTLPSQVEPFVPRLLSPQQWAQLMRAEIAKVLRDATEHDDLQYQRNAARLPRQEPPTGFKPAARALPAPPTGNTQQLKAKVNPKKQQAAGPATKSQQGDAARSKGQPLCTVDLLHHYGISSSPCRQTQCTALHHSAITGFPLAKATARIKAASLGDAQEAALIEHMSKDSVKFPDREVHDRPPGSRTKPQGKRSN
jgi:hypothetical protein